jgi:hypothetical protein
MAATIWRTGRRNVFNGPHIALILWKDAAYLGERGFSQFQFAYIVA